MRPDDSSVHVCFHCSQQIDNFHNFARKINQIQQVLYPLKEVVVQPTEETFAFEITIIDDDKNEFVVNPANENKVPSKSSQLTTVTTRSHPSMTVEEQEISFNKLKTSDSNKSTVEERFKNIEILEPNLEEEKDDDGPVNSNLPHNLVENGQLIYKGKRLMKMMSKFYSTTCDICDLRFDQISDLFEHQRTEHDKEPFVTCCSLKLSKLPRLIWHYVKHQQPEAFKCKICNYTVSRPKFLEYHLQTHSETKPFSCDHCDKKFIWKGALKSHLLHNHLQSAEKKTYLCVICYRQYATPGSLASHKKSTHFPNAEKTRNLCEICSKSFATYTSYKEHMISHSEDYEKHQLKCPECGKWLKNQRCLKSHMRTHSTADFKCKMCDYSSKKEGLLKNHLLTQHTADRPFQCTECNKTFKVKRHLTVHKTQAHTSSKSLKVCEFCGREFNSSSNYYTHRKTIHAHELSEAVKKKEEESQLKRIKIGLEN